MKQGLEREKSLSREVYKNENYFALDQWASYIWIIKAVKGLIPEKSNILEIGVGGGYVACILRNMGYNVTTYDVNDNLLPDKIVDISADIPVEDVGEFDCVICAEVLEHIPYEKLSKCVDNILKLTNKNAIITIPDSKRKYRLKVGIEGIAVHTFGTIYGRKYNPKKEEHFWELNYNNQYGYDEVRKIIGERCKIIEEGDILNNQYHHYYIIDSNTR